VFRAIAFRAIKVSCDEGSATTASAAAATSTLSVTVRDDDPPGSEGENAGDGAGNVLPGAEPGLFPASIIPDCPDCDARGDAADPALSFLDICNSGFAGASLVLARVVDGCTGDDATVDDASGGPAAGSDAGATCGFVEGSVA
jgi:hypothetical protein